MIYDHNNNLIDAIEEPFKDALMDYFKGLENKSYKYKEVSHFKYSIAKDHLWRELSNSDVIKDVKRTYLIADTIPLLLKLAILFSVINLIFIFF